MSYRDNYCAVLNYCRRRCDAEVAEDLCAEVFTRAWRGWPPQGNHLPWLYGIARNVVLEFYRERARENTKEALLSQQVRVCYNSLSPEDVIVAQRGVLDALLELSESDQEILRLHTWESLSIGEIAVVLDISASTARVRLHRARTRLLKALNSESVQPRHNQPITTRRRVQPVGDNGRGMRHFRKAGSYEE